MAISALTINLKSYSVLTRIKAENSMFALHRNSSCAQDLSKAACVSAKLFVGVMWSIWMKMMMDCGHGY